jgi:hypothetical protein
MSLFKKLTNLSVTLFIQKRETKGTGASIVAYQGKTEGE